MGTNIPLVLPPAFHPLSPSRNPTVSIALDKHGQPRHNKDDNSRNDRDEHGAAPPLRRAVRVRTSSVRTTSHPAPFRVHAVEVYPHSARAVSIPAIKKFPPEISVL